MLWHDVATMYTCNVAGWRVPCARSTDGTLSTRGRGLLDVLISINQIKTTTHET